MWFVFFVLMEVFKIVRFIVYSRKIQNGECILYMYSLEKEIFNVSESCCKR